MKKKLVAMSAAIVALLALAAGTAGATPATHFTTTFSDTVQVPAGELCDFNYQIAFTVTDIVTIAPNGHVTVVETQHNTHTNLDSGYSLSEVDHVTSVAQVSGTFINAGIYWHLRDANGHNVLVRAGEVRFDADTGEVIRFTPNTGFDQTFEQIICTALGGNPA